MDPSIYHRFFEVEDRHWWFAGRRAVVETLLAGLPAPDGGRAPSSRRILDVGCGTGGMLPLLSKYGRVTGIDSEPLALDYCRRRGMTDLHLQENFEAGEPYDLVTLFDVLEHVPDEAGFLNWTRALLRPGGRLIITVPAFPWLWSRHDELNHHQRRYTRERLRTALRGAGFRVVRASYFNFWLFPAAVASRVADGLARGGRRGRPVNPADEAEEILKPLQIGAANGLLTRVFASEAGLLRAVDLPWGVSIGAVAERVEE